MTKKDNSKNVVFVRTSESRAHLIRLAASSKNLSVNRYAENVLVEHATRTMSEFMRKREVVDTEPSNESTPDATAEQPGKAAG